MPSVTISALKPASPASTYKAEKPEKTERPERSEKPERTSASSRREVSNDIEQDDNSFLSYLLNNDQSFSVTNDPSSLESLTSSASFGGTFNMDPSMLVLPEGIDAASLVASAEGQVNFSPELLAALTPGVPSEIDAIGVVDGQVMAKMGGDPRLIATGLDPAQMQALVARLAAMAADQANAQATPAVSSQVAIVSFLPEQAAVDLPENTLILAPQAISDSAVKDSAQALTDAAASLLKKAASTEQNKDVSVSASLDLSTDSEVEGFDPLEFRLAAKPSRYGTVNLHTTTASTAPATPVVNADAQVNVNTAIKGVMQESAKGDTDAKLASSLSADLGLTTGSVTASFDPSLGAAVLTPTPAQTVSGIANPVLQNISAVQSHPATQAVANLINKAAQQGDGTKTLAIQLDPPELGKMQLKMKYVKGEPLRVHVVLEKADTMNMFQRDSHALQHALNNAGIQTDSSSLSFDLGGQGAFGDALQDQTGGTGQQAAWTPDTSGASDAAIETQLSVVIDPKTGLAHYNLLV